MLQSFTIAKFRYPRSSALCQTLVLYMYQIRLSACFRQSNFSNDLNALKV